MLIVLFAAFGFPFDSSLALATHGVGFFEFLPLGFREMQASKMKITRHSGWSMPVPKWQCSAPPDLSTIAVSRVLPNAHSAGCRQRAFRFAGVTLYNICCRANVPALGMVSHAINLIFYISAGEHFDPVDVLRQVQGTDLSFFAFCCSTHGLPGFTLDHGCLRLLIFPWRFNLLLPILRVPSQLSL